MLTHRTCSNCNHWSDSKSQLDGVRVAACHAQIIRKNLEMPLFKVTKGSDTCGQWEKVALRLLHRNDELLK
jgi:hypothetical protein